MNTRSLAHRVRMHVFTEAAATGRVPQLPQIAAALGVGSPDVSIVLRELAAAKALILAPNSDSIWAASPFCAVPSGFRVHAAGKRYWWDEVRELAPGEIVTAGQTWRLAHGWYKDKLKSDWRRHTVDEAEALLRSVGLTGEFWNLRA